MKQSKKNNGESIFSEARNVAEDISAVMTNSQTDSGNLERWLGENEYAKGVAERLSDPETLSDLCEEFKTNKTDKTLAVLQLSQELKRRRNKKLTIRIAATAAAAAVITIASLFVINNDRTPIENLNTIATLTESQQSTGGPFLITDNGEQIDLSKDATIGNAYSKNDTLVYGKQQANAGSTQLIYNTLILPEKCSYVVTLSDGTRVSLNAGSTLKYPTNFGADRREVMLHGEAYFDVVKDNDRPFVVTTENASVKVYGTRFNVNSYDKNLVKTSLISGSVGVTPNGRQEIRIAPGQMLTLNIESAQSQLSMFNINKYEAWQMGFFRCDDEPVSVILDDISHWYGVRFEYKSEKIRDVSISASINRNNSVEEVLQLLNATSNMNFNKKGAKVYVVED